MKFLTQRKKAFTIIELVIYMGLLAMLLLVFTDMFSLLVDKKLETESTSTIYQDADFIFSRLQYDFAHAKTILLPAAPGNPVTQLQLGFDTNTFDYYLDGTDLKRATGSAILQLNSFDTTISNVSFQRIGEGNAFDTIRLLFTITSKVKKQSGYESYQFKTTYGLREKE